MTNASNRATDLRLATTDDGTTGRLQIAVESVLGNIFSDGNSVEVLKNSDEIFPAILAVHWPPSRWPRAADRRPATRVGCRSRS